MENKFKQFVNDNKGFVVFYLIWFLLHLLLLVIGVGSKGDGLWPFGYSACRSCSFRSYDYDISEFVLYLIVPVVLWGIWKLIGKDINKAIDENN